MSEDKYDGKSRPNNRAFNDGYDKAFGKKKKVDKPKVIRVTTEELAEDNYQLRREVEKYKQALEQIVNYSTPDKEYVVQSFMNVLDIADKVLNEEN